MALQNAVPSFKNLSRNYHKVEKGEKVENYNYNIISTIWNIYENVHSLGKKIRRKHTAKSTALKIVGDFKFLFYAYIFRKWV